MKISYGITVHNESDELNKLLEMLLTRIDEEDEIVICVDGDDKDIQSIIERHEQHKQIIAYKRKLDGNFSDQKNSVIEKSTGDYIFHIDADEYPHETLLEQLKQIIEMNDGVDFIWITRVNTIECMTQEDIEKWRWRVTENNWVNYPDYQSRVFRRDKSIRWKRPLHELIDGCKTYAHLPPHEELSLYHPKTMKKQEQQNLFYNQNFSKEMNHRN
jgi:glycosyltransferase involved in cell wall biosynthesis